MSKGRLRILHSAENLHMSMGHDHRMDNALIFTNYSTVEDTFRSFCR